MKAEDRALIERNRQRAISIRQRNALFERLSPADRPRQGRRLHRAMSK